MRYRDLVTFEPVESVKQLREADRADQALEDVRTYIISEKMREQLTEVVLPNLRFDNPDFDHKGLLLIATYGTGKTHLMSVVSAVAENAELTKSLTDEATATAAAEIAQAWMAYSPVASMTPAVNSSESPGRNSPITKAHSTNTKLSTIAHTIAGPA